MIVGERFSESVVRVELGTMRSTGDGATILRPRAREGFSGIVGTVGEGDHNDTL